MAQRSTFRSENKRFYVLSASTNHIEPVAMTSYHHLNPAPENNSNSYEMETYKPLFNTFPEVTSKYQTPRQGCDVSPFIEDPFQERPKRSSNFKENNRIRKILRIPWVTYIMSTIQVCIFIYELVRMKQLTGSVIQTEPYFNPMVGPSTYVQINIGSRFYPCMHEIPGITDDLTLAWPCANSTTVDTQVCSLKELCNSSQVQPTQMWRLLGACFLHAGFLHIFFNLLLQMTIGREVERLIGSLRYLVIYILSGLSGNIFGLNFAGTGLSSSGASGALFGIIAANLIIFLLHRDQTTVRNYKILVAVLIAEVVVCFVLGLLPGLDNFAHIGGFVSGLLLSVILLNNPSFVHVTKIKSEKRRFSWKLNELNLKKRPFMVWTGFRILCLALLVAWFVGLTLNFTKNGGDNCAWCKYLSCLPVNNWCTIGELTTG